MNKLLIGLVNVYKKFISPILPPTCRYYPTCSTYMIDALKKHGAILGLIMGISRIIRCNPFAIFFPSTWVHFFEFLFTNEKSKLSLFIISVSGDFQYF